MLQFYVQNVRRLLLRTSGLLLLIIFILSSIATPVRAISHQERASSAGTIDLQTLSVETLVQPLCSGTTPTFRAFIRNNGTIASGFFNIQFIADGTSFYGGHYSIAAGAVDTHDHVWQNLTLGQHTLRFIANYDHSIKETNYKNNNGTMTFTVKNCASVDVAFRAPFNNGMTFTASQGYYNNTGVCNIGAAPDHCNNQLFGLDLVPGSSDNGQVLAPVGGTITGVPSDPKEFGCMQMKLDDGLSLNICHFSTWTVRDGQKVTRGKVLGTRSTPHVHISLDNRNGSCNGCLPVPFDRAHSLEGMTLSPDHDSTGVVYFYSGHYFMVESEEWQGLTGTSSNVAIP